MVQWVFDIDEYLYNVFGTAEKVVPWATFKVKTKE